MLISWACGRFLRLKYCITTEGRWPCAHTLQGQQHTTSEANSTIFPAISHLQLDNNLGVHLRACALVLFSWSWCIIIRSCAWGRPFMCTVIEHTHYYTGIKRMIWIGIFLTCKIAIRIDYSHVPLTCFKKYKINTNVFNVFTFYAWHGSGCMHSTTICLNDWKYNMLWQETNRCVFI